ncbi:MAG: hypothetical protein N2203_05135, partial [Bacteroidia bacterium]|nr:hypothetical protein [Bacteroidia bacterium]
MNTKNKKIIQILLGGLITWIYFFGIYWIGSKQTPSANQDEVNQLSDAENTKFHLNGTWYIVKNSDFDPQNPVISTNTVPINSLDSLPNWYKGEKIWLIYHSVDADSQLFNKVFHLIVNQKGASSVYLNKNLLLNIGKPSNNPENEICVNVSSPFLFYVDKPFTIYIEHSEQTPMIWKNKINYSHLSGLKFEIHSYHKSDADFILSFIIGFLITLACIHLLLFFFYTEIKDNLYFSLFLFFYTCVWIAIIMSNSKYFLTNLIGNKLIEIAIISTFIALIFFVQHLFKQYLNKILWALFICIFIFSVLDIFYQNSIIEILNITGIIWLIIFSVIFIFITVYRSAKQNIPGIKIVSFGILIFGILIFTIISLIFYEFISNFGSSHSNFSLSIKENDFTGLIIVLLLFLALFSIPISMSIYLAYKFAYTNKVLKNKLSEVENLNKTIIEKEKEKQLILQKQNELLEQQVKERTQEIFEQKNLIEQKNKDILDSINYASRIQKALITSDEYIQNHFQKENFFQDYFVLYLPKDIVSGDFYWANVNVQHPDKPHYLAVCDCTG